MVYAVVCSYQFTEHVVSAPQFSDQKQNSSYRLSFRPYSRQLVAPLKMSRGVIDRREGVIVRIEDDDGAGESYGEAVTLPYFGTETVDEACRLLAGLETVSFAALEEIPKHYFATRLAIESALLLRSPGVLSDPALSNRTMSVSKLLPSGVAAVEVLRKGLSEGFETFKWKVGIESAESEIAVLKKLFGELKSNNKLRLDANGGLSFARAASLLEFCEGTQVEFIEQPIAPDKLEESMELAARWSTPIALDESVATMDDIERVYRAGWRGLYVVKPSRLGELRAFLQWREASRCSIVYSSALETAVGTEMGLRVAASDPINSFSLGYGVAHWFFEDGLSLHLNSPRVCANNLPGKGFGEMWRLLKQRPHSGARQSP